MSSGSPPPRSAGLRRPAVGPGCSAGWRWVRRSWPPLTVSRPAFWLHCRSTVSSSAPAIPNCRSTSRPRRRLRVVGSRRARCTPASRSACSSPCGSASTVATPGRSSKPAPRHAPVPDSLADYPTHLAPHAGKVPDWASGNSPIDVRVIDEGTHLANDRGFESVTGRRGTGSRAATSTCHSSARADCSTPAT